MTPIDRAGQGAVLDEVGFARQAMIGIRVEGDIKSVAEKIEKFPRSTVS